MVHIHDTAPTRPANSITYITSALLLSFSERFSRVALFCAKQGVTQHTAEAFRSNDDDDAKVEKHEAERTCSGVLEEVWGTGIACSSCSRYTNQQGLAGLELESSNTLLSFLDTRACVYTCIVSIHSLSGPSPIANVHLLQLVHAVRRAIMPCTLAWSAQSAGCVIEEHVTCCPYPKCLVSFQGEPRKQGWL